jgi:hypothetical protein
MGIKSLLNSSGLEARYCRREDAGTIEPCRFHLVDLQSAAMFDPA